MAYIRIWKQRFNTKLQKKAMALLFDEIVIMGEMGESDLAQYVCKVNNDHLRTLPEGTVINTFVNGNKADLRIGKYLNIIPFKVDGRKSNVYASYSILRAHNVEETENALVYTNGNRKGKEPLYICRMA